MRFRLIAACARNDVALVRAIAEGEPEVVAAALVRALLAAGASTSDVAYPCGYADVDELIRTARG